MVLPVIAALENLSISGEQTPDITVLGMPSALSKLSNTGVEILTFRDFLNLETDQDAIDWGRELAKQHHSPTSEIALDESVAYLGLSFKDLVFRLGFDSATKLVNERGRHAFHPVSILKRVFEKCRPDIVVTTNSPRAEAAAIEVANELGVLSVIMTDLFSGLPSYVLKAQHITFFNKYARDKFIEDGLVIPQESSLHLTGNPAFDNLLVSPPKANRDWRICNFPEMVSEQFVLHADMPGYLDSRTNVSYVRTPADIVGEMEACYAAARLNNAAYVVRPHPSQDVEFYHRWIVGKSEAFIGSDCELTNLLVNCDLVVARTTTVALEAILLGRQVLQLDMDFHTDLPLAKLGLCDGINGYEEISSAIGIILEKNNSVAFKKNNSEKLTDGKPAAMKIAHLVLSCIHNQLN